MYSGIAKIMGLIAARLYTLTRRISHRRYENECKKEEGSQILLLVHEKRNFPRCNILVSWFIISLLRVFISFLVNTEFILIDVKYVVNTETNLVNLRSLYIQTFWINYFKDSRIRISIREKLFYHCLWDKRIFGSYFIDH